MKEDQVQLYPCNAITLSIVPEDDTLMYIEMRTPSGVSHAVYAYESITKYVDVSPSNALIMRFEM